MKSTQLTFLAAFALLTIAAIQPALAAQVQTLEIGAAAPDFSLPGVDGKTYSLKDFAGAKVLCIIWTCNHCPTAQAYEQRIIQLHKDFHDKGVAVVAISPNSPQAVRLDELRYSDLSDSFDEMKIRAKESTAFRFLISTTGTRRRPHTPTASLPRRTSSFSIRSARCVMSGRSTIQT